MVVALPEDCAAVGRGGDVQAFVGGIGTLGAEEADEVAVERRAVVVAGLAVDALHEVEVALDERVFLHGAAVVEGGVCAHPGLLFLLAVLQALVGGELQADVLVHGEPLAGCEVVAAVDLVAAAAALLVVDGHPLVLVVEVGMPAPLAAAVVVDVVGRASAPAERAGTVPRVVLIYEFFMGGEAVSPRRCIAVHGNKVQWAYGPVQEINAASPRFNFLTQN